MLTTNVENIFYTLLKNNSNPKTELYYINNFTLLVAVVLSAQSTDISVNKVTKLLFNIIKSPEDIINLGESKLKEYIKTIGLYNSKAKNIIALSLELVSKYNKNIPNKLEQLTALPGVGRKTANVVLNIAFKQPTIAVDTHVFRVSNRLGIVNTKTVIETEQKLEQVVPNEYKPFTHNLLVLHGRYICKAKKPLCLSCTVKDYCYTNKHLVSKVVVKN